MKHLCFLLDDTKEYKKAQKEYAKKRYSSFFIQLYCGTTNKKKIQKQLTRLHSDFPTAVIVGATTAGEICNAKMYEEQFFVSLSCFEKTNITTTYTKEVSKEGGIATANKVVTKDTKAVIILAEGLKSNDNEAFLEGIKKRYPDLLVAGGLAGDNFKLKKTYVFLGEKIYQEGIVAIALNSKELYASNEYNLNWVPIGKEFKITDVRGSIVDTIDGIRAVDFFEKYLGKEVLKYKKIALPNFQLLFKEGSTVVARTPLAIEGKSLVFAAPIKKNQVVQFGFSNDALVLDGSSTIGAKISNKPAEAIYVFSCIARKTLLGKVLEEEFGSFEKIAPSAGFFTYGEFYSSSTNNVLLNCTTTILILSEKKKHKKVEIKKDIQKTLNNITFNALSHFIKQTSQELKSNTKLLNQYKEAVDASSLVSKTDTNGIITYVNDNFCAISKYSKEELLGQNHNIIRDPQVSPFVFKKMWQSIKAGKIWRGVFSNKAKDGSIYYVDATIVPIFDEQGNIEEYIALRRDITKQIQAKKRLVEKEKLIRAILDNQESIVIHASKKDGMLGVNKKLFEYFDFVSVEQFKQKHSCICDLFLEEKGYIHPKHEPNWLDEIADNEHRDYKVKMRLKNKKVHTFTIKIKKIFEHEFIINLYDITTLEEALFKAYSSERAKSLFLANMSHEIRTPLNGILGFTDILTKKQLDKEIKRYIDIIHNSGQTLLNIVNDILDFSKIESGELVLYETQTNLFEELEGAVSTFASLSKQKKINYYVYIDTQIPRLLRCDAQRIKQVLNNLISNAIKFTPQEGEVHVEVRLKSLQQNKAVIHFSVKDSGIGIEKEKIATIFEPFSQADNSISRKYGGTGLGLAISNQYIKMMNSTIELKSTLNEGSEFYFDVAFDVLDTRASVENNLNDEHFSVAVMTSFEGISCGINDIVYTYLKAWNYRYSEIEEIEQIDENIDILVVCAKYFDTLTCKRILEQHPHLHIIYIEGIETSIACEHSRFYLIEQPLTGSALFDHLISIVDPEIIQHSGDEICSLASYDQAHILVAEDNETNQMLISVLLDERKIAYKIVQNGALVLEEIAKNDIYDLIFMDINMPLLDGIETTKKLRQNGYSKPIVSLSANVIESDTKTFKEAGMDDTLNKPIVPAELDAILKTYLPQEESNESGYDVIKLEEIAKSLKINDEAVVLALMKSLAKTLLHIKEDIKNAKLDKALLHKLKGAVGNMRLEKFYRYIASIEEKYTKSSKEEKHLFEEQIMGYVDNAIEQIEMLG